MKCNINILSGDGPDWLSRVAVWRAQMMFKWWVWSDMVQLKSIKNHIHPLSLTEVSTIYEYANIINFKSLITEYNAHFQSVNSWFITKVLISFAYRFQFPFVPIDVKLPWTQLKTPSTFFMLKVFQPASFKRLSLWKIYRKCATDGISDVGMDITAEWIQALVFSLRHCMRIYGKSALSCYVMETCTVTNLCMFGMRIHAVCMTVNGIISWSPSAELDEYVIYHHYSNPLFYCASVQWFRPICISQLVNGLRLQMELYLQHRLFMKGTIKGASETEIEGEMSVESSRDVSIM